MKSLQSLKMALYAGKEADLPQLSAPSVDHSPTPPAEPPEASKYALHKVAEAVAELPPPFPATEWKWSDPLLSSSASQVEVTSFGDISKTYLSYSPYDEWIQRMIKAIEAVDGECHKLRAEVFAYRQQVADLERRLTSLEKEDHP